MSQETPPRGARQQVDLVRAPGTTRPVLGLIEPGSEDLRTRTLTQCGVSPSPRTEPSGALAVALPLRTCTVLAHQLPAAARRLLAEGETTRPSDAAGLVVVRVRLR